MFLTYGIPGSRAPLLTVVVTRLTVLVVIRVLDHGAVFHTRRSILEVLALPHTVSRSLYKRWTIVSHSAWKAQKNLRQLESLLSSSIQRSEMGMIIFLTASTLCSEGVGLRSPSTQTHTHTHAHSPRPCSLWNTPHHTGRTLSRSPGTGPLCRCTTRCTSLRICNVAHRIQVRNMAKRKCSSTFTKRAKTTKTLFGPWMVVNFRENCTDNKGTTHWKFLQDKQWMFSGPQQPRDEHSGWHTAWSRSATQGEWMSVPASEWAAGEHPGTIHLFVFVSEQRSCVSSADALSVWCMFWWLYSKNSPNAQTSMFRLDSSTSTHDRDVVVRCCARWHPGCCCYATNPIECRPRSRAWRFSWQWSVHFQPETVPYSSFKRMCVPKVAKRKKEGSLPESGNIPLVPCCSSRIPQWNTERNFPGQAESTPWGCRADTWTAERTHAPFSVRLDRESPATCCRSAAQLTGVCGVNQTTRSSKPNKAKDKHLSLSSQTCCLRTFRQAHCSSVHYFVRRVSGSWGRPTPPPQHTHTHTHTLTSRAPCHWWSRGRWSSSGRRSSGDAPAPSGSPWSPSLSWSGSARMGPWPGWTAPGPWDKGTMDFALVYMDGDDRGSTHNGWADYDANTKYSPVKGWNEDLDGAPDTCAVRKLLNVAHVQEVIIVQSITTCEEQQRLGENRMGSHSTSNE